MANFLTLNDAASIDKLDRLLGVHNFAFLYVLNTATQPLAVKVLAQAQPLSNRFANLYVVEVPAISSAISQFFKDELKLPADGSYGYNFDQWAAFSSSIDTNTIANATLISEGDPGADPDRVLFSYTTAATYDGE